MMVAGQGVKWLPVALILIVFGCGNIALAVVGLIAMNDPFGVAIGIARIVAGLALLALIVTYPRARRVNRHVARRPGG